MNVQIDSIGIGVTCLCADDIGMALRSWRDLIKAYEIFSMAESAAGLTLKPKKCFIVPLAGPLSPHIISSLRDFLAANTPQWYDFSIVSAAEYLGVWLGPAAKQHHWTNATTDFLDRVRTIADAKVAPSLDIRT